MPGFWNIQRQNLWQNGQQEGEGNDTNRIQKSGWSKEFAQFDEAELATIILCVRSLVEMGCWTDLVNYCVYRIEESMDETLLEDLDEDSVVVH